MGDRRAWRSATATVLGAVVLSLCSGVLAAGALLGAPGSVPAEVSFEGRALAGGQGAQARSIVLVVAPHPDDELTAWPALQDVGTDVYAVFLTLSRGEYTRACRDVDGQVQGQIGERAPQPRPQGVGHPTCGHARLTSWWAFLDAAGEALPAARTGPTTQVAEDGHGGRRADVWAGERGARVAMSLPDGAVSAGDTAAAVDQVLALRGDQLPDLPVARIVIASYWNDSAHRGNRTLAGGGCEAAHECPGVTSAYEYEHVDHRAVARSVTAVAAAASAQTWLVVPPGAGETVRGWLGAPTTARVVQRSLPDAHYDELVGLLHENYGWLSYPEPVWATGDRASAETGVLFAREHDYLVLDPAGS